MKWKVCLPFFIMSKSVTFGITVYIRISIENNFLVSSLFMRDIINVLIFFKPYFSQNVNRATICPSTHISKVPLSNCQSLAKEARQGTVMVRPLLLIFCHPAAGKNTTQYREEEREVNTNSHFSRNNKNEQSTTHIPQLWNCHCEKIQQN